MSRCYNRSTLNRLHPKASTPCNRDVAEEEPFAPRLVVFMQRCTDRRALENEQGALDAISRVPWQRVELLGVGDVGTCRLEIYRVRWPQPLRLELWLKSFALYFRDQPGLGGLQQALTAVAETWHLGLAQVQSVRGAAVNVRRQEHER